MMKASWKCCINFASVYFWKFARLVSLYIPYAKLENEKLQKISHKANGFTFFHQNGRLSI